MGTPNRASITVSRAKALVVILSIAVVAFVLGAVSMSGVIPGLSMSSVRNQTYEPIVTGGGSRTACIEMCNITYSGDNTKYRAWQTCLDNCGQY